jgi:hypothetical protein
MKKTLSLCLLLLCCVLAVADHLPAKLQARGRPENTLAGIDIEHDTPATVLRKLGPPTKKVSVPNNPQWTGYLWDTPNLRLEVEVTRGKDKDYLGTVTIVRRGDATDPAPAPAGRESTGRGLKLGDTLETLKGLYGGRFQVGKQDAVPVNTDPFLSVPGSQTAVVQWTPIEFTLTAGFNNGGRIIALSLSPPECYPGECR